MSSDDRAFLMQAVLSLNLEGSVPYLYPRLHALVSMPRYTDVYILRKTSLLQYFQHSVAICGAVRLS